ncbi:MAG: DUF2207 domain-containing protein [Caldilineaceae bacterium]|nr:DUF2207 domain-containing protein [Caldilineaceae bacterium]
MRIWQSWVTRIGVATLVAVLLLIPTSVAHAQEKSLVWERFDVDMVVNKDGSLDVQEHQTIRFTQGSFTSGYRDIPVANFDYLDQWAITDDQGNTYVRRDGSREPYTFSVEESGRQYVILWYFPETRNTSVTYTLRYRVHNGLRFYEGGDQVWWKAIYGDRAFPVLAGRVRVVVPDGAQISEWAAYVNEIDARNYAAASVVEGNQAVIFDLTRRLDSGQEFEVRVQFTHGVVDGVAPAWQQRADEQAMQRDAELAYRQRWGPIASLGFGALGILLALGGPAGLYALWYRLGRDKPVEMVADYLPEPPDELPPGAAGVLLDETVDMQDIVATLVDLAQRKVISITEEKQEGFLRMGHDFIYRKERDDAPLQPYEQSLLNAFFGERDEVRLSELKNKFYTHVPVIKQAMYDAVVKAGLFPRNPETVRTLYVVLGVLGLVGAVIVAIGMGAAFADLTPAGVLPGVGLGVTAIGLMVLSRVMPRKTDQGAEVAARWEAFKRYLQNIDRYTDLEQQKAIWDRWLPYAIAFGIDRSYIRKFEAVDAPAPGWYIPSPDLYGPYRRRYYGRPWVAGMPPGGEGGSSSGSGEGGGGLGGGLGDMSRGMGGSLASMSAGLGAMLNSASTTFTSRPAETSSRGGWSGGGGGFSGGGFSGGGGGGGGGGGFR